MAAAGGGARGRLCVCLAPTHPPPRSTAPCSNHLLVQLAKLNLCAVHNSFLYSDPCRAATAFLSLPAITAVQLSAALLPSVALYRMESRLRRGFLQARLAPAPVPAAPAADVGVAGASTSGK